MNPADQDPIDPCRDWSFFHFLVSTIESSDSDSDTPSAPAAREAIGIAPQVTVLEDCVDPCRDWSQMHG